LSRCPIDDDLKRRITRRDVLASASALTLGASKTATGVVTAASATGTSSTAPAAPVAGAPVRLSLNENAFGCSPHAVEAIQRNLVDLPRYTESQVQSLTAEIAAKENVPAAQIVLGAVLPALGVHLGLRGGPGGQFVYSRPGYTDLILAAQQTGGTAVAVDLTSGWRMTCRESGSA
jgi:histidinol-phosphate aminotransferase